jgi:hypothetical protein
MTNTITGDMRNVSVLVCNVYTDERHIESIYVPIRMIVDQVHKMLDDKSLGSDSPFVYALCDPDIDKIEKYNHYVLAN